MLFLIEADCCSGYSLPRFSSLTSGIDSRAIHRAEYHMPTCLPRSLIVELVVAGPVIALLLAASLDLTDLLPQLSNLCFYLSHAFRSIYSVRETCIDHRGEG